MTTIRPSQIDFERVGDELMIRFSASDGESAMVILSTRQLPAVAARLLQESGSTSVIPIHQDLLTRDRTLAPHAYTIAKHQDGSLRLTFLVRIDDRDVTIAFELSPTDAAKLAQELD